MKSKKDQFKEESIDIRGGLDRFLSKWYYFVLTCAMAFGIAKLYLRYQESIYRVSTTLLIKSDQDSYRSLGALNIFGERKNIFDEIGLIKSFDMIYNAINQLDFKVSYYHVGDIRTIELYKHAPFKVVLDTASFQITNVPFYITILPGNKYRLEARFSNAQIYDINSNTIEGVSKSVKINEVLSFGQTYKNENISFKILLQDPYYLSNDSKLYFTINNIENITQLYKYKLGVYPINKEASILELAVSGPLLEKDIDFLNKITEVYIQSGLDQKNQMAINTINFIDSQLKEILGSLKVAENEMESFKSTNKSMQMGTAASTAFEKLEDLEEQKGNHLMKKKYYEYVLDYIKSSRDLKEIVAPSAIGIEDAILTKLINDLIQLKAERSQLALSSTEKNPLRIAMDQKIKYTTDALFENVKNILNVTDIPIKDLNRKIGEIENTVRKLPAAERKLLDIERKFNLNDHLYNFLLEKRAEAGITKASNKADHMIVDTAKTISATRIAPRESFIYIVSLMLGFLFPILLIFANKFLNDKILSKEDLENQTDIPILGIIGHNTNNSNLVVFEKPKSSIAEAFRSLRINLNYLAPESKEKVITITSSVSGEGKTFSSINLASIIAISNKKTVLIGADLRKPKIYNDFGLINTVGLSSYLVGKSTLDEIISSTQIDNLDLILSGPIPPNPAELIALPKMDKLIEELKHKYDYIILDTPPVGLVSDALVLMKHSNINIYIVRHKYTEKKWLEKIENLHTEGKIKDISIVINDLVDKDASYGYGYRYGYGYYYNSYGYYEDDKQTKFDFLKDIFKKTNSKKEV